MADKPQSACIWLLVPVRMRAGPCEAQRGHCLRGASTIKLTLSERAWERSGGVRARRVVSGALLQVVQESLDEHRALDAGDHLDGFAAVHAGFDVDLMRIS